MCCNRCSGMEDRESSPMIMDVNRAAKENCNFRKSVWTGKCMQMTLMSIPPRGEIGLEVHEKTDQMIRVEQGRGIAMMGNCQCRPNMELEIFEKYRQRTTEIIFYLCTASSSQENSA